MRKDTVWAQCSKRPRLHVALWDPLKSFLLPALTVTSNSACKPTLTKKTLANGSHSNIIALWNMWYAFVVVHLVYWAAKPAERVLGHIICWLICLAAQTHDRAPDHHHQDQRRSIITYSTYPRERRFAFRSREVITVIADEATTCQRRVRGNGLASGSGQPATRGPGQLGKPQTPSPSSWRGRCLPDLHRALDSRDCNMHIWPLANWGHFPPKVILLYPSQNTHLPGLNGRPETTKRPTSPPSFFFSPQNLHHSY